MRIALYLAALASVTYSQLINLDTIALDFPPPELVKAPVNVESDTPATSTPDAISPLQSVSAKKRGLVEKRDGDCSPYPAGSGPVPSPDTPSAFQSDADFATMAVLAPRPDGYSLVFKNLNASLQASNYMGLYTLTNYDTLTCASKCDQANCSAFNVYLERDPTVNANAQKCPNPPSTTNFKCTLWGAPVSPGEVTNSGQYQDSFQVVIAGSNGYNKKSPPSSVSCYSGPQELGGAINAPPSSGSYMGYQYFPFSQSQGYDPQTCADACDAQTLYDSQHPAADGDFMSCAFFNAYVLSKNGIPQGLYCSMYNKTWDPSYGTNYGQYRGSDRYTVSESYSYSKTCNNPNQPPQSSLSSSRPVSSATSTASPTSSPSSSPTASSKSSSSLITSVISVGSSTISPSTSSSTSTYTPNPSCDPYPDNLVLNPEFACGLAPWVAGTGPYGSAGPSPGGYQFYGTGPYVPGGQKPPRVSQQIGVTVGQTYTLTFQSYFQYCSAAGATIAVLVDDFTVYSVTDCLSTPGSYQNNTVRYTATKSPSTLEFDFQDYAYYTGGYMTMAIDNVVLKLAPPQPSTSGPPSTTSTATTSASTACNTGTPIIQNGGFESGSISPWVGRGTAGQSYDFLVSPGSTNPGGGNYAFYANLQVPTSPYGNGAVGHDLYQTLNTCAGTNYSVTADYRFVYGTYGCTFKFQGNVVTGGAANAAGWQRMSATFQATRNDYTIDFEMTCKTPNNVEVDLVNVTAN